MREKELEYLRSELNQRVIFSYEHSHKLFGYILLVWGGTLVLLGNAKQDSFIRFEVILFIMATIFFISVVVLYLLSQRNSDNMKEISKLAAYIAVFYEEAPVEMVPNKPKDIIFWELATLKTNKKDMGKSTLEKWCNKLKNEYFWLSLIAMGIIVVVAFIMFDSFNDSKRSNKKIVYSFDIKERNSAGEDPVKYVVEKFNSPFDTTDRGRNTKFNLMLGGCIGYIFISAILSFIILTHLSLNWEDWEDKKKHYLRLFLKYAIEKKYYTENDIKNRFGEDFCAEIVNKKVQKSLNNVSLILHP